jgi:hypothetical protein
VRCRTWPPPCAPTARAFCSIVRRSAAHDIANFICASRGDACHVSPERAADPLHRSRINAGLPSVGGVRARVSVLGWCSGTQGRWEARDVVAPAGEKNVPALVGRAQRDISPRACVISAAFLQRSREDFGHLRQIPVVPRIECWPLSKRGPGMCHNHYQPQRAARRAGA